MRRFHLAALAAVSVLSAQNAGAAVVADGVIDAVTPIDILATGGPLDGLPGGFYVFSTSATILSSYIGAVPRYHHYAVSDRGTWLYGSGRFTEGAWPTGTEPVFTVRRNTVSWYMQAPPPKVTHSDECFFGRPDDCGVNEHVDAILAIMGADIRVAPGSEGLTWTVTVSDTLPPGIPEPSAWGLMILGFGLAGYTLRNRSRWPSPGPKSQS